MFSPDFSVFCVVYSFIIFGLTKAAFFLYNLFMNKIVWNKDNKIRLVVLPCLLVLAVVVVLFHEKIALWLLPCPINTYLGLLCPGCGMTRAVKAICKFHFLQGILYNPAAPILGLIGGLYYIEQWFLLFGKRIHLFPRKPWIYITLGILFGIYCILRNIPAFSFLSIA